MERVITIKEAAVLKSGTSKRGPWTLSVVKDTNGDSYTTFDNALRELAEGNIGASARVLFTQDDRGSKAEDLTILSEAPQSPSNGTGELERFPDVVVDPRPYNGSYEANKQKKIMRQTAAKVAAAIEAAHPDPNGFDIEAFLSLADGLVSYFEEGVNAAVGVPFGE